MTEGRQSGESKQRFSTLRTLEMKHSAETHLRRRGTMFLFGTYHLLARDVRQLSSQLIGSSGLSCSQSSTIQS